MGSGFSEAARSLSNTLRARPLPATERIFTGQKQGKNGTVWLLPVVAHEELKMPQDPHADESKIGFLPTEEIPCNPEGDTVQSRPSAREKARALMEQYMRQVVVAEGRDPGILTAGTVFEGQYVVERLLGRGGMGAVYLASKVGDPREKAAIKLSLEKDTEGSGARAQGMRQEEAAYRVLLETGSRLFPKFYGAGLGEQGHYYVIMEYVAGTSLSACLKGREKMPLYRIIEVAMQLCGLQALHERGVIYKDLKPGNVQVREGSGEAVLLDFGLAEKANKPQSGDFFNGTPAYASPEQVQVKDQDQRVDIYALGIMLYEMITGTNPMIEADDMQTLRGQLTKETPHLSIKEFEARFRLEETATWKKVKAIIFPLEQLIMKMTAKNRDQRMGSLEEVMQALQPIYEIARTLAAEENLAKQQTA